MGGVFGAAPGLTPTRSLDSEVSAATGVGTPNVAPPLQALPGGGKVAPEPVPNPIGDQSPISGRSTKSRASNPSDRVPDIWKHAPRGPVDRVAWRMAMRHAGMLRKR